MINWMEGLTVESGAGFPGEVISLKCLKEE